MTTAKALSRKQAKEIYNQIEGMFNITLPNNYQLSLNNKAKVFILRKSKHLDQLNFDFLRTDRLGLYLGEYKNGFFRPSMQGAQFLVQEAKSQGTSVKNQLELSKEQVEILLKGQELDFPNHPDATALIITYQTHPICFAQVKAGKILNYVPKTFRGTTIL